MNSQAWNHNHPGSLLARHNPPGLETPLQNSQSEWHHAAFLNSLAWQFNIALNTSLVLKHIGNISGPCCKNRLVRINGWQEKSNLYAAWLAICQVKSDVPNTLVRRSPTFQTPALLIRKSLVRPLHQLTKQTSIGHLSTAQAES